MSSESKPVQFAEPAEQDNIDRALLIWANTWEDRPVDFIDNFLGTTTPAMAIQTIQAASILSRYIVGGYKAEYPFSVTYRIQPGANDLDARLTAQESLNAFGAWAYEQKPDIGDGLTVLRMEPTTRAVLLAAYDDGDQDYQILMKMTYERMN